MLFIFSFWLIFSNISFSSSYISEINVKGNVEVPDFIINNSINLKPGQQFSMKDIISSHRVLSDLEFIDEVTILPFIKDGKLLIEIDVVEAEDVYARLKKRRIFTNSERKSGNVPPIVSNISLEGIYFADKEYINSLVALTKGNFFTQDSVDLSVIQLEKSGLFSSVDYVLSFSDKDKEVEITFFVKENQFVGSNITVDGNTLIPTEELLDLISIETDSVLNTSKLRESSLAISEAYKDRGYLGVNVIPKSIDGQFVLYIYESIVDSIRFERYKYVEGESLDLFTKDHVLRRAITVEEGKPLREEDLKRSIDRLRRLGLFKNIAPDIRPSSDGNNIVLIFKIEEENGIKIHGGLSGTLAGDIQANATAEDKNFLGRAFNMGLSFNIDLSNIREWKGRAFFKDPWIHGTNGIQYGVEVFRSTLDSAAEYGRFANTMLTGASVTFSFPIIDSLMFSVSESFRLVEEMNHKFTPWDNFLSNVLGAGLNFSILNNYLNPTSGIKSFIHFEWDARIRNPFIKYNNFDNKPDIITLRLGSEFYFPGFFKSNYFATRIISSYSWFFPDNGFNRNRFRVGGPSTVRGFRSDSIGGNMYYVLNIENRSIIYDEAVRLEFLLFFDIGMAAYSSHIRDFFSISKHKKSFGAGISLKNFMIPISIYFTMPIAEEGLSIKPVFHVGYTF